MLLRTRLRDADAGISYVKVCMIRVVLQFDADRAPQRVLKERVLVPWKKRSSATEQTLERIPDKVKNDLLPETSKYQTRSIRSHERASLRINICLPSICRITVNDVLQSECQLIAKHPS